MRESGRVIARRFPQILSAVLLVALLTAGLVQLRGADRDLHAARQSYRAVRVVDGIVVAASLTDSDARFLAAVKSVVPARAKFRVQVGDGSGCGNNGLLRFYVVYVLLPRPAVCTDGPQWWLFLRVTQPHLPRSSTIVVSAPHALLVRVQAGR